MPGYYQRYIKLDKPRIEKLKRTMIHQQDMNNTNLNEIGKNSTDLLAHSLQQKSTHKTSGFFNKIRDIFFRKRGKGQKTGIIEIYDVIICTPRRIDIKTKSGGSYLYEKCNYEETEHKLLTTDEYRKNPVDEQEQDSVYQFIKDPRTVSIDHEEYQQIHFLRFEKDNRKQSKHTKYSQFVITDIDLSMSGNIQVKRFIE